MPQHDRLFTELLETFFIEFKELISPQVEQLMHNNHIVFLQQEIITDVLYKGQHTVDILVETKLAGEDGVILIHVETQAQRLPDYNRKMFKYFSRLHEKHQKKILPIVVYSHTSKAVEPDHYNVEFSFLKVLEFNFYKLQLKKEPWKNQQNEFYQSREGRPQN